MGDSQSLQVRQVSNFRWNRLDVVVVEVSVGGHDEESDVTVRSKNYVAIQALPALVAVFLP